MRINYSIVFVRNMERSVVFYRDVIGIPLKFASPEWSEFVTEGTTLALHRCDGAAADANMPQPTSAGQCRPGFQVPNLDEFHSRMVENEVTCFQQPTETFGARIAQYIDPDGLVFSVGEGRSDE